MLRMVHEVDVLPSLQCHAQLRPAPDDLHTFLLRLQVSNLQVSRPPAFICRLPAPAWRLEAMLLKASCAMLLL